MSYDHNIYKEQMAVLVSGMRLDHTVHASVPDRSSGHGHLYFTKNKTWESSCANGHWDSLIALLEALRDCGITEVMVETTYIRSGTYVNSSF